MSHRNVNEFVETRTLRMRKNRVILINKEKCSTSTQGVTIMKKEINVIMYMHSKIKEQLRYSLCKVRFQCEAFFLEAPLATSWKSVFADLSSVSFIAMLLWVFRPLLLKKASVMESLIFTQWVQKEIPKKFPSYSYSPLFCKRSYLKIINQIPPLQITEQADNFPSSLIRMNCTNNVHCLGKHDKMDIKVLSLRDVHY